MKIGLSALTHELETAISICKNNHLNHIEVGIDNIEDCEILEKYIDMIKEENISIGIHLPMELNTCENITYIRNKWIDYIHKLNKELKNIDIEYFNLHLGYAMGTRLQKNRVKYLENSIKFLNKIDKDICVTIENTYSQKGDFTNIGNKVEDFEYIISNVSNNIYFCYDIGHNLIDGSSYIEKISSNIKVIHLSDNDGIEDKHIGIGKGILKEDNIKNMIDAKPEYLVLEIIYDDLEISIDRIKKYL